MERSNFIVRHLSESVAIIKRSQCQKFVTDFGVSFLFKEVSAKARAKADHYPTPKTIWEGRGARTPKLFAGWVVIALASGFGTDFSDLFFGCGAILLLK